VLWAGQQKNMSSIPDKGKRVFFPPLRPDQPPIKCLPGGKRLRFKCDHSPRSNTEVTNVCGYTSTPSSVFMVLCEMNRDIFKLLTMFL
jgi:hypothetical protein